MSMPDPRATAQIPQTPMRNSLLPILAVLVISLLVIPLSRGGPAAGSGGPAVDPGVLRRVVGGLYQVASMPLTIDNQVAIDVAHGSDPLALDPGRIVVISGSDRSPLTAAVMRALAEQITDRHGAAILDPMPVPGGDTDHVLALGASWRAAIDTISGTPPSAPGGPCTAVVRIQLTSMRLPADHPAAGLQGAGNTIHATLRITHASHGGQGSWPGWYAAFGRSIGASVLATVAPGPTGPPDLTIPDWGTSLPQPAMVDVLRWSAAFQTELLRGWVGRIESLATIGPDGRSMPSLERLKKVLTHGGWKPSQGDAAGYALWSREQDSAWLAVRSDAEGHDISLWWERPHASTLFSQWLDAATSGQEPALERAARLEDTSTIQAGTPPIPVPAPADIRHHARVALRAYQDSPAIPQNLRLQAKTLLATLPP